MQPYNPSTQHPESVLIMWDFSALHNGRPTATITRRSDRAEVQVYSDLSAPVEVNFDDLFPKTESEISIPANVEDTTES